MDLEKGSFLAHERSRDRALREEWRSEKKQYQSKRSKSENDDRSDTSRSAYIMLG